LCTGKDECTTAEYVLGRIEAKARYNLNPLCLGQPSRRGTGPARQPGARRSHDDRQRNSADRA
jgi:hypothetical protein